MQEKFAKVTKVQFNKDDMIIDETVYKKTMTIYKTKRVVNLLLKLYKKSLRRAGSDKTKLAKVRGNYNRKLSKIRKNWQTEMEALPPRKQPQVIYPKKSKYSKEVIQRLWRLADKQIEQLIDELQTKSVEVLLVPVIKVGAQAENLAEKEEASR